MNKSFRALGQTKELVVVDLAIGEALKGVGKPNRPHVVFVGEMVFQPLECLLALCEAGVDRLHQFGGAAPLCQFVLNGLERLFHYFDGFAVDDLRGVLFHERDEAVNNEFLSLDSASCAHDVLFLSLQS